MKERKKGQRLERFVCDYVVLDLETTSTNINDAKIIEIAAIKVKDGVIKERFETLINPGEDIPPSATRINSITDDMVKNAPCLEDVLDDFLAFVEGEVLVGHNITTFDMNILYDAIKDYNGMDFSNDYIDTLYLARKCNDSITNYKLNTICQYYGIDTSGAHRAMNDCYMTEECLKKLRMEYDEHGFIKCSKKESSSNHHYVKYSEETKALQQLQGFLMGIISDEKLTIEEVLALDNWMKNNIELQGNYPFDRVFKSLNYVLEDGVIEKRELEELTELFKQFTMPTEDSESVIIAGIKDRHFCLTGKFMCGEKEVVQNMITEKGGFCDKTVKKSTDYVVVGSFGNENWKQGTYGEKIKKAMEWKEKGSNVEIITEEKFLSFISENNDKVENQDIGDEVETLVMCVDITEDSTGWKRNIQDMLDKMIIELELPENSLFLAQNIGRVTKEVTSYSVCIYEPEYPKTSYRKADQTRNSVVMNIKEKNDKLELIIGLIQYEKVIYDKELETKILKSDPQNIHVYFERDANDLIEYIKMHTEYRIKTYTSKTSAFGCCSKFNACSDAKKCIHENRLYSMACSYRANLEAGKIYYGRE